MTFDLQKIEELQHHLSEADGICRDLMLTIKFQEMEIAELQQELEAVKQQKKLLVKNLTAMSKELEAQLSQYDLSPSDNDQDIENPPLDISANREVVNELIKTYVKMHPDAPIRKIASDLSLSPSMVHRHLKKIKEEQDEVKEARSAAV